MARSSLQVRLSSSIRRMTLPPFGAAFFLGKADYFRRLPGREGEGGPAACTPPPGSGNHLSARPHPAIYRRLLPPACLHRRWFRQPTSAQGMAFPQIQGEPCSQGAVQWQKPRASIAEALGLFSTLSV